MRADRLLSLVLLLQANARLPAPVAAERLEVSVRTVMRDVEALSMAGIPVFTERGRRGGIRLLESYRMGLAGLSSREAAGLAVGQPRLAGDLGLGDALDMAIEKIIGAGGSALRGGLEQGRASILVDVDPWMRTGEAVPLLPLVHDGLCRGRRLDLEYGDSDGVRRGVIVDPLGLVAKAGVWYLVATAARPGDPALFRVSRVRSCHVLEEPAVRPPGFELAAAWAALRSSVEVRQRGLEVTIGVDPVALPMVERLLASRIRERQPAAGGGRPLLHLSFGGAGHAVGSLMGLGTRVEVLDPPEVRAALGDAARELASLYGA